MALDTVNKIKQAEQASTDDEARARRQAEEYIKKSNEEAQSRAADELKLLQNERVNQINLAKEQAQKVLDEAKNNAEKAAQALFVSAKAKENQTITKIIEMII